MRVIAAGCEYAGVTTLIDEIAKWGAARGIHHHLDDHFTIPDAFHLSPEEQQGMLEMLPAIKERFQRFQIAYHVLLLRRYEHILLGGFHIEEAVYGPRYYYPGLRTEIRKFETEMPGDLILVHLTARAEVIRARMAAAPHPHLLVPDEDVPRVLDGFREAVAASWIRRKVEIDTSELTPEQLLEAFLERSFPHLNERDMLVRMQEVSP